MTVFSWQIRREFAMIFKISPWIYRDFLEIYCDSAMKCANFDFTGPWKLPLYHRDLKRALLKAQV